jgi:hypothetical protein
MFPFLFRAREFLVPNLGRKRHRKKSARAIKPSRLALTNRAELHVIQRATTPAREPTPITVDVVSRAVVPARVEQIPAAAAYLIGIGVFFSTAATFLVRLFACCFISHNVILSFWVLFVACHIFRVTADRQLCRLPAS